MQKYLKTLGIEGTLLKVMIGLGVVFLLAAGAYTLDTSRNLWPTTEGRVIQSKVIVQGIQGRRRTSCWNDVQVDYEYSVEGNSYTGTSHFYPSDKQPSVEDLPAGKTLLVHYNPLMKGMSTAAPDGQSSGYKAWMAFALIGMVALPIIARSQNGQAALMRPELVEFLDAFARLVESGVSMPEAFEKAINERRNRLLTLGPYLEQAMSAYKLSRIPLHQSLLQIGKSKNIEELCLLASTLSTASLTHSSIGYQLRAQSRTLRDKLDAERLQERLEEARRPRNKWID